MNNKIETLEQLQAEIKVLKLRKAEDELYFHQKKEHYKKMFTSPINSLKKAFSFLSTNKGPENDGHGPDPVNADWVTTIARMFVPYVLNSTLFRGKGMIAKSLLTLLSQRVIGPNLFNKNVLSNWIDKATQMVNSTIKNKKEKQRMAYGIPPDSETF